MDLSRPSNSQADPLSDLLSTLGPRSVRCTRLAASGDWALFFPARPRLKFVAVLRGTCWVTVAGEAHALREGDIYLLSEVCFAVASRPDVPAVDGMPFYEGVGRDSLRLGGEDTVMLGGGITFAADRMRLLLEMLPRFLLVPRSTQAEAIAAMLAQLEREWHRPQIGRASMLERLTDMLLIAAIRAEMPGAAGTSPGLIGAMADRWVGQALRLMHGAIARPWTVEELAATVGMSRSAFSARFVRLVGRPPLDYLRHWRMVRAHQAIASGAGPLVGLAADLGYASQSAFGHAYKRAYGHSPGTERLRSSREVTRPA